MTTRLYPRAATGVLLILLALLAACASSPLERRQVVLYSEGDMTARGEAAYSQMRAEVAASEDAARTAAPIMTAIRTYWGRDGMFFTLRSRRRFGLRAVA